MGRTAKCSAEVCYRVRDALGLDHSPQSFSHLRKEATLGYLFLFGMFISLRDLVRVWRVNSNYGQKC